MQAYQSSPNMEEDENTIRKGYSATGFQIVVIGALAAVAYSAELKWVVAAGFAALIVVQNESGGRLYDLCIRLRRTNILLAGRNSN